MPSCSARPARSVTESARERETFRYYSSLLSSAKYSNDGASIASSDLATSSDNILTALAQLATCQTGASRALISLFNHERQFIIAEATPALPLVPNVQHENQSGEELWLCGTAIPRAQSACNYTLCHSQSTGTDETKLPLVLVPDLQADGRFRLRPYSRPGSPAKFYAAVPIRSRRGINIGVLCVLDPGNIEWDDRKTNVMRNLSRTIMERLEATSFKAANRRSERMNRGLGSFVEGRATVTGWQFGPRSAAYNDDIKAEGTLNVRQQILHQKEEDASISAEFTHGGNDGSFPFPKTTTSVDNPAPTNSARRLSLDATSSAEEPTIHGIFSRAANIIRESIEVEGCLFLDAAVGSFRPAENNARGFGTDKRDSRCTGSDSSDGEERYSSHDETVQRKCKVLGFSTTDMSSVDGARNPLRHGAMQEKFLRGLLRQYPKGHIFNFDGQGELQSSDSSEGASSESSLPLMSPNEDAAWARLPQILPAFSQGDATSGPRLRLPKTASEGNQLLQVFPGARSVAFVPVWDSRKERWCAGGFIYTLTNSRVFTTEGELSFLRAFGMLAMAETLRCETLLSEKAKTDALGSLSHEIRSPLHGIVLGVELMRDTDLTVFQGNITHTIETCCRTMIDTIDHLLDFSKINNFKTTKKRQKHATAPRGLPHSDSSRSIHAGMKSLSANVRLDALAEEVIESVFAGFNFQHISIAQLAKQKTALNADIHANRKMDAMRAMEDFDPNRTASGDMQLTFGDASIFLSIDSTCSWAFYTQPGAIRRIIMNLFGNSLKHTTKGTIRVILKQTKSKRRSNERLVSIIVADAGNGISQDYLRNELFKPFSQENALAPGSGLGLSIVKQITAQLRGRIKVSSEVGVGTTVTVILPLIALSPEAKLPESDEDTEFERQIKQLSGLRVRLLGFDENRTSETEESESVLDEEEVNGHRLIRAVCRDWLRMEAISGLQAEDLAPDLVLWSEDSLPLGTVPDQTLTKPPCIVVCANALVAYQRSTAPSSVKEPGILEFISQPVGPRKLAKIVLLALDRWIAQQVTLPKRSESPSPTLSATADSDAVIDSLSELDALPASPQHSDLSPLLEMSEMLQVPPTPPISPPRSMPPPSTPKIEFLLVDDNHINLKILSAYLHKLGLSYQTATNGREAVDVFVRDPTQCKCIFMDISMPIMDGFEATRLIRAHEAELGSVTTPTTIFALSGLASSSAQQEAFWSGVDLFLTKPVKLKELGSILRSRSLLKAS
ncbi:hypothetical protein N0V93_006753 [Gnomoniopsis smithogilvyi]|uniref:Nik-1 protein (Os-1p protein) n=1 Tax=Gnomoniopsis smithogilvyi TaxID=1191159 RepID=A0A9W8YNT8_9PEZI|nr:hypothetical protein N0V93_006753 [Gnomoniopsis smithogilvyi]